MLTFTYSDAGLALTKRFEGLRLTAYQDSGGVWTIGYGHTGKDVHQGMTITEAEAEALLQQDIAGAVRAVNSLVTSAITQGIFDALGDFAFNEGAHRLATSTLLRQVNAGLFDSAKHEFGLWVYDGSKILPGLVERRAAEAALFAGGTQ